MKKRGLSDWYIPTSALANLLPLFVVIVAYLTSKSFLLLFNTRHGDFTLLKVAVALGVIGVSLLAWARMPLYRQRRFFTFGSRALDDRHKRLYRWAYRFIVPCVLLLSLILLLVR
jgi:hypothetical protein